PTSNLLLPTPPMHNYSPFPYTTLFRSVVLVTNADPLVMDIKMEATGIEPYFHELYSSHTFNAAKEHSEFWPVLQQQHGFNAERTDRKSTRLNSSHVSISYAVFCLKNKH